MSALESQIRNFWSTVLAHHSELEKSESAETDAYEAILAALQTVHDELFFEFSLSAAPDEQHELVVTADGNRDLFDLVKDLVASAPRIHGWTIVALKPKIGFPLSASWDDLVIDVSSVMFEPIHSPEGEFGLKLYVRDVPKKRLEDVHNAILRAIDNGLGEERFALSIDFTEVSPFLPNPITQDLYPLTELDDYLEKRIPLRSAN